MAETPQITPTSLAEAHDLLLFDLDGVVYVGEDAVPGAVEAISRAYDDGRAIGYATNNASRTPQEVAEHLRRLGIPARDEEVTNSSQAAAQLVVERLGQGARVLPVGGPGVRAALVEAGLVPVTPADDQPAAVVQGFGRQLGWSDLADAAAAIRGGALWVATNTDLTLPTERGPAPGNGSLVGAVRNAVDVDPLVAGKPEPTLFHAAARRVGAERPLVVGDRLDTDVAGAVRSEMTGALVLTGLTSALALLSAAAGERPDLVLPDLGALHAPPPSRARLVEGGAVCGGARAVLDGTILSATGAAPGASLADLLDLLRAACGVAWAAADAGAGTVTPDPALAAALTDLSARCRRAQPSS
ncbi:Haloacid Dehalogenase Superfamily Class (subfamily) IIA [Quadrisphaera granulorum]|uniref:HAD superfamily hydrolase (TIGR01450 family) n=1 Tax=Quadrisphaera granulorum TaxID=317664 RepID=A0A315ZVM2_9ACTN|nr:HAD-IIA family hydrolase [Quadrisphaera granulorum]PWJ49253.1 HAD superfamily hydrolase (TIGR01450 family) [Quadrisphaera granulorum]SZE98170.1 Haloacid Dehalogenase Superfamily Class (subfamily) IIA [Quadrisphaera granulorum]